MDNLRRRRHWLRIALRASSHLLGSGGRACCRWPVHLGMAISVGLMPLHLHAQEEPPAPTATIASSGPSDTTVHPTSSVADAKPSAGPDQREGAGVIVLRFRMSSESEASVNTSLPEDGASGGGQASGAPAPPQTDWRDAPQKGIPGRVVQFIRVAEEAPSGTPPGEDAGSANPDRQRADEPPRLKSHTRVRWLGAAKHESETGRNGDPADPEAVEKRAPSGGSPASQPQGHRPTECPGAPNAEAPPRGDDSMPADAGEETAESHPYDAPTASGTAEEQTRKGEPPAFTPEEIRIRDRIVECLDYFQQNPENVVRRGPWALMHTILPYGAKTEILAGSRKVNAIGWLCYNGVSARQRMFQPTRYGFKPNVGPGMQGHEGQFLAILAQSRVPDDFPLKIGGRMYTVRDLVNYEMATCRERTELTFKLIGLSYYLEQDARWRDNRGRWWNLEKLLVEEMAQPVNGAACGGTHRLMALSYAVIRRNKAGYDLEGNWARAEQYLNDFVDFTMKLQNPDGSFSTRWFEGRGAEPDVERKVQTTGHIAEWLVFTLPDDHLRTDRIQSAVGFLADTIAAEPDRDWPIGPRGHALRALALYNQRVFGIAPGNRAEDSESIARSAESTSRRNR